MTSASGPAGRLVPGELDTLPGDIELNAGRPTVRLTVANTGDRPIQVGSHYHFFETNDALSFDRPKAYGFRLDIPAGTAVRFEPGQTRDVDLVALAGARVVYGFAGRVMGPLDKVPQRPKEAPAAKAPASRGAAGKPAGRTTKAPAGTKKAPATRKPGAAGAKSKKGAGR